MATQPIQPTYCAYDTIVIPRELRMPSTGSSSEFRPTAIGVFAYEQHTTLVDAVKDIAQRLPERVKTEQGWFSQFERRRREALMGALADKEQDSGCIDYILGLQKGSTPVPEVVTPFHKTGRYFGIRREARNIAAYWDLGQGRLITPSPRFVEVPSDISVGAFIRSNAPTVQLQVEQIEFPFS